MFPLGTYSLVLNGCFLLLIIMKKNKVNFYIDGFNIYHAIKKMKNNKLKWINYRLLCEAILNTNDEINEILYFSAYAFWRKDGQIRHDIFIRALKSQNINVILGNFKEKSKYIKKFNYTYKYHEEKESDVNIGIHLVRDACQKNCDKAIILSGDSDFVPAIKMAKKENNNLKIGVVIPANVQASSLKNVSDFSIKLSKFNLNNFLFPKIILLPNGKQIICPKEWK